MQPATSHIFVDILSDGRLVYRDSGTKRFASRAAYQAQFKPKKRKKRKKFVKKMWRCTFIVYLVQSGGESPYAKFRITAWSTSEQGALDLANGILEKEAPEYVGHKDWRFEASACPQGERVNEAVELIEYNVDKVETAVFVEEGKKIAADEKDEKEHVGLGF